MPYQEHECCLPIPDDSVVWRYLDFTKFISILERKQLYFANPATFDDPFECSMTIPTINLRKQTLKAHFPDDEKIQKTIFQLFQELDKNSIQYLAVNCWHISAIESAAMWKLHLKSNEGIAIQTTFKDLKKAFQPETASVFIGKINYIDPDKDIISELNIFSRALSKLKSFEYEAELRAIVMPTQKSSEGLEPKLGGGMYVDIDPECLIGKVYIEPTAPEWFKNLVCMVMQRYGIQKKIEYSSLRRKPVY